MMRFTFMLLLALLPRSVKAADAIWFEYEPSSTIYVRVYTSHSAAVAAALSPGTSGNTRLYYVTDATIGTAGMSSASAGSYAFTIFSGTPSTSASDTALGSGVMRWTGSVSVDPLPTAAAGSAGGLARVADLPEGGEGGLTIPVNQVAVPPSRTWILEPGSTVLMGDYSKGLKAGNPQLYALDFRNDLAANGLVTSVESIELVSVDGEDPEEGEEGLIWDETLEDATKVGVDKRQAKVEFTGAEAGTYVVDVTVNYGPQDGGGEATGRVSIVVVE